ncbi:MAG: MFS transporter [Promethearchaeota archaeon]|nr:MAG: MFS transporter [Candidatus Lokiarchaeota archaeon]
MEQYRPYGKLTQRERFGYALGAVPFGLLAYIFTFKYIEFFFDDLKLLPEYFIIGQVIYLVINAINDPLLGQLSDRTNREKWGSRRIIYIKYGGPIWALTFILVWFPWSLDNQFVIFLHYVISICIFDTMLTLVVLSWMALLPEMTTDTGERSLVNLIVGILGLLAIVPVLIIIATMKTTSFNFQILMVTIAIASTILSLIVARESFERAEFHNDQVFSLGKSLKETMKSKSFLLYVGFNFCNTFLGGIGLSYLFVYALVLGENFGAAIGAFIMISIFVAVFSNIVCMRIRPKWGMRKIILIFGLLRAIGVLVLFLLIINPMPLWVIWVAFIWYTFFGGYSIFSIPLLHLSFDEDEVKNGIRREGMFLGINALVTKPALSLGPIVATIILVYYGYVQGSDIQPSSAILGIKILFFLIPAIVVSISLIFIYFHPLYGERLEILEKKLESLHQEKANRI